MGSLKTRSLAGFIQWWKNACLKCHYVVPQCSLENFDLNMLVLKKGTGDMGENIYDSESGKIIKPW